MFPDGGVFRRGRPQRRRVNNTPQRRPLFRRVGKRKKKKKKSSPFDPPTPNRPHRYHSGDLSRLARQSGERFFVKLPPVISPARSIAAERARTHTQTAFIHAGSSWRRLPSSPTPRRSDSPATPSSADERFIHLASGFLNESLSSSV